MLDFVVKYSSDNNDSVMHRGMLRFRPIAPKPPGGEPVANAADQEKKNGSGKNRVRRTKRKYTRVRCRQNKRKITPPEKSRNKVVTLELLPGKSESEKIKQNNIINQFTLDYGMMAVKGDQMALKSVKSHVIETLIIVECVTTTDTVMDSTGLGLGFSDMDKMSNLQVDTYPGFVSDGTNKVVWINEAYKKMVAKGSEEGGVMVSLVVKEKLPRFCPSFACRIRLIQHTRLGQKWNKIVPCDVWRMEFAGFAWKLDVNTALGLEI